MNGRIVILEDDEDIRELFSVFLQENCFEVHLHSRVFKKLADVERLAPDLMIVDVAMPRMDGPALVRALRADRELATIPIIFYSASYREVESRAIAQAAGVEHVIGKPADPELVLQTVQRALGAKAPPTSFESCCLLRGCTDGCVARDLSSGKIPSSGGAAAASGNGLFVFIAATICARRCET